MTRQDTTTPTTDRLRALLDAATNEAVQALVATDTGTLMTKYAALTHRLHVIQNKSGHLNRSEASSVRTQRDLICAEILRRTGDL